MTPDEVEEAARLYAQGLSLAQLADRLDRLATTIHLALRAASVPMRDCHGQER